MEHAPPSVLAGHRFRDPLQVTCRGDGAPPLPVLARVTRVFSGDTQAAVFGQLRDAVRAGGVPEDELVLLRAGRGQDESWTELRMLAADRAEVTDREY